MLNPRFIDGMPGQGLTACILYSEAPMPNARSIGRASGHGRTTFKGTRIFGKPSQTLVTVCVLVLDFLVFPNTSFFDVLSRNAPHARLAKASGNGCPKVM